ncbi:hypothetical protein AVEN_40950-1 [Araneus ventricosus]|uniref:CCHC-type domain-containing protein n=1 Tax=Araneus ventricosus TaxID=182803 RepID=A0A4Y2F949_ARAVE|nr:hypothetical protein AVEN_40950-1 [Araneus ventricosus]
MFLRQSDPNSLVGVSTLLIEAKPAPKAKITDLKQTHSKDLLVTFQSEQDESTFQREIADSIQLRDKIILSEPPKRNPSVIVYNIPKGITEPAIQQGLKSISPSLQDLKVKFVFRGRDPEVQNWVLKVPALEFNLFKNIQRLPINWTPFNISEFIHFKRCNHCQCFGHTSRDCFFSIPNCAYCGGHHRSISYTADHPSCINCYHHNLKHGTSLPFSHSSRDRSCPCFLATKENYINSIDYS